MGVSVATIDTPFQASLAPAQQFSFDLARTLPSPGGLAAADIDSWRTVNRAWKAGQSVFRDETTGAFYLQNQAGSIPIKRPRIGLYKSFIPSMDEGWTRWLLENFEFAYQNVSNPEINGGNLRQRWDVLVFPDQSAASIKDGYKEGAMPQQYVGGLGTAAAENLKNFVKAGGTLVFLNHSTEYALEAFALPAKNVVHGLPSRDFYSPGSLLNATLDTHSPLALGVPSDIAIWSEGSPAWELRDGSDARVVVQYPKSNILASGWLLGAKFLEGRAALLDIPYGQGRVVLFGMRPQFRAQSYQGFKLFFNSLVLAK